MPLLSLICFFQLIPPVQNTVTVPLLVPNITEIPGICNNFLGHLLCWCTVYRYLGETFKVQQNEEKTGKGESVCLASSPGSLSVLGRFLFLVPSSVDDTSTLPVLNTGTGIVPRYQKRITPDLLGTHVT